MTTDGANRRVQSPDRPGGRPLDATRDQALRTAALALLAEVGYDRLTLEAVAARAHAGKTTIYRRWKGKADLVVDALAASKRMPEFPDTGSLKDDLQAVAHALVGPESQFDAQLAVGMITALARDPQLREIFRERFLQPRTMGMRSVLERAVSRGEIPEDRDLDLLARLFPALALQHLVIYGEPPPPKMAEQMMADVVHRLATCDC